MIKNKLLLVALLFFGISMCSGSPDQEPSTFRRVQNSVLGSPIVPIMIAGIVSPKLTPWFPIDYPILKKIFAAGLGYGLTRVIPGLKRNELVGIGSAITAFLSIKDAQ